MSDEELDRVGGCIFLLDYEVLLGRLVSELDRGFICFWYFFVCLRNFVLWFLLVKIFFYGRDILSIFIYIKENLIKLLINIINKVFEVY